MRTSLISIACLGGLLGHAVMAQTPTDSPSPAQVVETMEQLNGITPGARRNHVVGVCASGYFVGNPKVQAYSRSPLFSGERIPVVARFSLAGGNPKAPDTARSPRGLALALRVSENQVQHFTLLNVPVFGAAQPQTFYEALLAAKPDPATGKPHPEAQKTFLATHPDAQPLAQFMASHNPPASYAQSDFYGIHTFKLINAKNEAQLVRWRFEPSLGVLRLSDEEMKTRPSRFLAQDLQARLSQGPLHWQMVLTLGQADDEQHNPTVRWPQNRPEIQAGELTLTASSPEVSSEGKGPCTQINFDPLVMSDGVAPTDDPILLFRSPAYANSYVKRLTGQ